MHDEFCDITIMKFTSYLNIIIFLNFIIEIQKALVFAKNSSVHYVCEKNSLRLRLF